MVKCSNCGAPQRTASDGSVQDCEYCSDGPKKALDPLALAQSLGRDQGNVQKFIENLAKTLETAFPSHTQVDWSGFFSKQVSGVRLELEHFTYHAEVSGSRLVCHRMKTVRGVKIKDEQVALHKWLEELAHDLARMAQENEEAKRALSRFVS